MMLILGFTPIILLFSTAAMVIFRILATRNRRPGVSLLHAALVESPSKSSFTERGWRYQVCAYVFGGIVAAVLIGNLVMGLGR